MKQVKLQNWFSLFSVAAFIFYFMHVFIGQENYPGYSWMKQAVSDLTATDSPSYLIATKYSSLYGMFSCIGTIFLCLIVQNKFNKAFRLGIYLYASLLQKYFVYLKFLHEASLNAIILRLGESKINEPSYFVLEMALDFCKSLMR